MFKNEIGKAVLFQAICELEAKYPLAKISRDGEGEEIYGYEGYEFIEEITYLFSQENNLLSGFLGKTNDGISWNCGVVAIGRFDEFEEEIIEPIFGYWPGVLQGVTIWQGEELAEFVSQVLAKGFYV